MEKENGSIVGDLINFRGMVYAPINEQGVVFLFGKVVEDLNMYVEEIKPGFPDCIARRYVATGWKRIRVEFEFSSKNFLDHRHDHKGCDVIVCWSHNWPDCPLEVVELREVIKGLPNPPMERPGAGKDGPMTVEEWFRKHKIAHGVENLFLEMMEHLQAANKEVFYNVGATALSVYCPERVMTYVYPRKSGIRLELFVGNARLGEVKTLGSPDKPTKWGALLIHSKEDLAQAKPWLLESMKRIKQALARNENTGWYSRVEHETPEEEADTPPPAQLPKQRRKPNPPEVGGMSPPLAKE